MPRIVPSQVRAFIDSLPAPTVEGSVHFIGIGSARLQALLDILVEIPPELLTMDVADYVSLLTAKAEIGVILDTWKSNRNAGHSITPYSYHVSTDPIRKIRTALERCPDESPAPATSELNFITDATLRANLRNDMGAVNRALSNSEWKAATVLAGSAIEALLLWDLLQRNPNDVTTAVSALTRNQTFRKQPSPDLEKWVLYEYNEVARHLKVIQDATYTATNLARDFRNLIHPGVAQRTGQQCSRGTALTCVGALEHVVEDLTP